MLAHPVSDTTLREHKRENNIIAAFHRSIKIFLTEKAIKHSERIMVSCIFVVIHHPN
jgi:hypothetical protein